MKQLILALFTILFSFSALLAQTDAMQSLKGICIYIDYEDAPANTEAAQLDSLLNGIYYTETNVNRTFRQYWRQETRRNVDITHDIFFYRAPKPASFYASVTWQEGIDLWRLALEDVVANNPSFDWNALSRHGNGGLREVMVISSSSAPAGVGGAHYPQYVLSNGVFISSIHGSFIKYPGQTTNNLFVIAHEAGHSIFGFPDTYDTEVISSGTGTYSLMSGQGPDMPPVGAPFLVIEGWGHAVEIDEPGEHRVTLLADGDSIFLYRNPHDEAEFFVIEARKNSTLGNSNFPTSLGLMVWHTDDNVTTSNTLSQMSYDQHYRHSVEQADGLFQLESGPGRPADSKDIYIPGREFTDDTTPNSEWWTGEASDFELKDITFVGNDRLEFTVTIPERHTEHYEVIPSENWFFLESAPFQSGHGPQLAYDGDPSTFYHVPWTSDQQRPHDLTVYLADEYLITEVYYRANDNFSPPYEGRVRECVVYTSDDNSYFEPIADAWLKRTRYNQYIPTIPTIGSYLKFSALSGFDNDPRTSIAELSIRGIKTSLLATAEVTNRLYLNIYPNPTADYLMVAVETPEPTYIVIYDMSGKAVSGALIHRNERLDLTHLTSGAYTIAAKAGNEVDRKKFVKM